MHGIIRLWAGLVCVALAAGCGGEGEYTAKPVGYPRMELPEPAYKPFAHTGYPYSFEYNSLATCAPDTDRMSEPFWTDITYPALGAQVELTYKPVDGDPKKLNQYMEDARKLANRHQVRANGIEESQLIAGTGNLARVFRLSGQVPTQYQFVVTDSTKHWLRAALYFKTAEKNDSLAPAIDYIAEDMAHLLKTLRWEGQR